MKVLVIGATGNLGLRLVAALLTHSHTVIAYVRSQSKLESLLPKPIYSRITVIQGDAKGSHAIKTAILDNDCNAIINTAGLAALAPWGSSDLPIIFQAVLTAVQNVGAERKMPLRVWFMGGFSVLNVPGSKSLIMNL